MQVLCKNPHCDSRVAVELPEDATRCCFCGDMYHWHGVNIKQIRKEEAEIKKIDEARYRYQQFHLLLALLMLPMGLVVSLVLPKNFYWTVPVGVVIIALAYVIMKLSLINKKFPYPKKS